MWKVRVEIHVRLYMKYGYLLHRVWRKPQALNVIVWKSIQNYIQIQKKQDRHCTYDVTLRRFREIIVVAEVQ